MLTPIMAFLPEFDYFLKEQTNHLIILLPVLIRIRVNKNMQEQFNQHVDP